MITVDNVSHPFDSLDTKKLQDFKLQCLHALPTHKKYNILYIDPPWHYNSSASSLHNQCSKHYPTMTFNDLCQLPIKTLADKNSALFVWTTGPKFDECIHLINHWGFEYKTIFIVWRKLNKNNESTVKVPGWWSWSSHEFLLVATIGTPLKLFHNKKHYVNQEFASVREAHSKKPQEIKNIIEHFLSCNNKIELFARETTTKWDTWGLEIPNFYNSQSLRDVSIQCNIINTEINTSLQYNNDNNNINPKSQDISPKKSNNHKHNCKCIICDPSKRSSGTKTHKKNCTCVICKQKQLNSLVN